MTNSSFSALCRSQRPFVVFDETDLSDWVGMEITTQTMVDHVVVGAIPPGEFQYQSVWNPDIDSVDYEQN